MQRRSLVASIGVFIIAFALLAPIIPMKDIGNTLLTLAPAKSEDVTSSSAQDNSSMSYCEVPYGYSEPPGCGVMRDPSGVYYMRDLGNGTWEMDLASYQSLLKDPYAGICKGNVSIVDDTVYLTCPQSNISAGGLTMLPSSSSIQAAPSGGLGSVTYLLFGVGGLYSDGNYRIVP